MITNPQRVAAIQTVLDWIKVTMPVGQVLEVNTLQELAERIGAEYSFTSKVVFQLKEKGFMVVIRSRGSFDSYKLIKDISTLTGESVGQWITAHATETSRLLRDKKKGMLLTTNEQLAEPLSVNDSSEVIKNSESLFGNLTSNYTKAHLPTPEPIPAEPVTLSESELNLSPAQLLMKRAQELLDEENRLKAEQEERARKAAEQPTDNSSQYEARLKSLEGKTDTLLHFFQQAASVLRGFEPVGSPDEVNVPPAIEEAPEPAVSPMRAELVQLVNAWAAATMKTEHEVWKYLYGNFSLRSKSRFNPYPHGAAVKDKNYLSIMEKQGHLEELYLLAKSLFVLPAIKS